MSTLPSFPPSLLSASIAHALAHPIRVEILRSLCDAMLTVGEITEQLARPQANISQHLAVLREVNLVDATRDGMSITYCLSTPRINELLDLLDELGENIPLDGFTPRGRGGRHRGGRGQGYGRGRQKLQNL